MGGTVEVVLDAKKEEQNEEQGRRLSKNNCAQYFVLHVVTLFLPTEYDVLRQCQKVANCGTGRMRDIVLGGAFLLRWTFNQHEDE